MPMLFPELPQPEPKVDIARRVFDAWKATTNHPKSRMDAKRQALIVARLNDGYSEQDLKLAALGISVCPWNQGQNPDHRIYDSVELCYRNADKVDYFIREGENQKVREARQIKEKEMMHEANLRASTTGNVYRQSRESLLRVVGK